MNKTDKKRAREISVLDKMISLYCKKNHAKGAADGKGGKIVPGIARGVSAARANNNAHSGRTNKHKNNHENAAHLCIECQKLQEYAHAKIECCPFIENKTFCSNCKVHCFAPDMREKIRKVMRFSGPRMIIYCPHLTIWHVLCSVREKKK